MNIVPALTAHELINKLTLEKCTTKKWPSNITFYCEGLNAKISHENTWIQIKNKLTPFNCEGLVP